MQELIHLIAVLVTEELERKTQDEELTPKEE